jgi:ComF family protein
LKAAELGNRLLDFFLPTACVGCGGRLPLDRPDDLVCVNCLGRMRAIPSPRCPRCDLPFGTARPPGRPCTACHEWPAFLEGAWSAVVLEPPASALVHALKYEGWRELAPVMGARMGAVALLRVPSGAGASPPRIVPVPTTPQRERQRGYNQARLLADAVAVRTGWPLLDALVRTGESRTQVSLHAAERMANVSRAFEVRSDALPLTAGARVVLVDDVLTTGATSLAAAQALHSGGALGVSVVTFARALPGRDLRAPERS